MTTKKICLLFLYGMGTYLFLNYCFIWLSPFLLAYLIFKAMRSGARWLSSKLPFSIPFLPFLLFLFFLIGLFTLLMILSFSFIQFIRVFLQTDFFNQLLCFFESLSLPATLASPLETFIQQLILFLSSALMIFPKLFSFLSLSCLIAFLLLLQPHQLDPYFNQLSFSFQQKFLNVHASLIKTIKKMSQSTLLLMGITWIECFIGLLLIREPHAFSLSLLIACFDSLPLLGVGVVLLPLSLSQFFFGFQKKALGLLLIYLIVTSLRFLIEPKLLAHQMGIPVLIHLLCMVICLNLFGAIGFLYAPFLCVLGMDILHKRQQKTHTITKELNT